MKIASFAFLATMVVLAGSAVAQSPPDQTVVYDPAPHAGPFDLNMSMESNHSFRIGNKDYSFDAAETYISQRKLGRSGQYTVLLHGNPPAPDYICYVILMHETGSAGYLVSAGESPRVIKVTIAAQPYGTWLRTCKNR